VSEKCVGGQLVDRRRTKAHAETGGINDLGLTLWKGSPMPCEEELQGIATALRNGSPYFKAGWNANALQAFIRDGGCCVYCGKHLLNTWEAAKTATIDHLLPRCNHPERGWNVDNLVPACAECNHIKLNYDPFEGEGKALVITEGVRLHLIRKAKEEIDKKTKANEYWESEFQAAKLRSQEAVTQYRQYKESPVTA
jgi:HNH endonuclease